MLTSGFTFRWRIVTVQVRSARSRRLDRDADVCVESKQGGGWKVVDGEAWLDVFSTGRVGAPATQLCGGPTLHGLL